LRVDQQTLGDLEIFECQSGSGSLFDFFDCTRTSGGRSKLKRRFQEPMSEPREIRATQAALQFVIAHLGACTVPTDDYRLQVVEKYLGSNIVPISASGAVRAAAEAGWYKLRYADTFAQVANGVAMTAQLLSSLARLTGTLRSFDPPPVMREVLDAIDGPLASPELGRMLHGGAAPRSAGAVARCDRLLRVGLKERLRQAIDALYAFDALVSMARASAHHRLSFPVIAEGSAPSVRIEGVFHPFLDRPRRNDFDLEGRTLMFLTGPNMAGKTTYMRACAIAVYLAHLGMGVPADRMTITPFDCLFSSITTIDNIRLGYSYFFTEVRRMRELAQLLAAGHRAFVVIDEMFKGTNVRDAHDATRAVTTALATYAGGMFVISSHLTELTEDLERVPTVVLRYFDAEMRDGTPIYGYELKRGSSSQRLGLTLLEREGVLDMLRTLPRAHASVQ